MTFDQVFMNPPYNLGGKITNEVKKHANRTVCLMPLSCYKKKSDELWRYVVSMELADPKMFVDADITGNLCICTLTGGIVDVFKTYEDMWFETLPENLVLFYRANQKLSIRYHISEIRNALASDYDHYLDFMESNRLCDGTTGGGGFGSGGSGYKWNYYGDPNLGAGLATIHFETKKHKDNFCTWWYSGKKGSSLASKLQIGLKLKTVSDVCSIAIPQIDWESISDTQLWKEGKYDEAVLSTMHLRWNDEKDGVDKII